MRIEIEVKKTKHVNELGQEIWLAKARFGRPRQNRKRPILSASITPKRAISGALRAVIRRVNRG